MLQQLNLSSNRMSDLSQQSFNGLGQLHTLDLSANNISNVATDDFYGLTSLQTLHLDMNAVVKINLEGLSKLRELSLDHNALTSSALVGIRNLSSLRTVNLENNEIRHLADEAFDLCPAVDSLKLRHNRLRVVNANVTSSLSLKHLDVGYNQLESAGLAVLAPSLPPLESLVLDGNSLSAIPATLLNSSINSLLELDLSNNKLTSESLFPIIAELRTLQILRLDKNLLVTLPASFAQSQLNSTLETLSLRNNRLGQQTLSVLSAFSRLQHLLLDGNEISEISSKPFRRMNSLHTLSLSNNRITRLYNDSFHGIERTVIHLSLARNQIGQVEVGTFSSLYYVRRLDLSDNRITQLSLPSVMSQLNYFSAARNLLLEFPAGLRSTPLLLSLDLSSNRISRLPRFDLFSNNRMQLIDFSNNALENIDDMRYLGSVDVLNLSRNRLSSVDAAILNRTTTVQLLDLSRNRFVRAPSSITRASDVVINLRLDHNRISSLSDWTASTVYRSNLEKLSLRGNVIRELPTSFMSAVRASLTELDLRDNGLTTLDRQLFDDVPYLTGVLLAGNPLDCDCRLAWLRQLALRVTVDKARCSSPTDVIGTLAICYNVSHCDDIDHELYNITHDICWQDDFELTTTTSPGGVTDSLALIVGLSIAAAVLLIIVVVVAWYFCRRYRRRHTPRSANGDTSMTHGITDAYDTMAETDDIQLETKA